MGTWFALKADGPRPMFAFLAQKRSLVREVRGLGHTPGAAMAIALELELEPRARNWPELGTKLRVLMAEGAQLCPTINRVRAQPYSRSKTNERKAQCTILSPHPNCGRYNRRPCSAGSARRCCGRHMKRLLPAAVLIATVLIVIYAFNTADAQKSASRAFKRSVGVTQYHVARQRGVIEHPSESVAG